MFAGVVLDSRRDVGELQDRTSQLRIPLHQLAHEGALCAADVEDRHRRADIDGGRGFADHRRREIGHRGDELACFGGVLAEVFEDSRPQRSNRLRGARRDRFGQEYRGQPERGSDGGLSGDFCRRAGRSCP